MISDVTLEYNKLDYFNLINIGEQVLCSLFEEDDSFEITPVQLQEMCKEVSKYFVDFEAITEASMDGAYSKLGFDGSAKSKVDNAAKDIAKDIKANGINKATKERIHNKIAKLFEDLSKLVNANLEALFQNKSAEELDKKKAAKAAIVLVWILLINSLCATVLTLLLGPTVGQAVLCIVVAPLTEESAKIISVKGKFEKEFWALFNIYEFSSYLVKGFAGMTAAKILGQAPAFTGKQLVKGRVAAVGMHSVNTIIHKMFDSDKIKEKLNIKNDKDSKDKATVASFIVGLLIHGTWNAMAVFNPAFNSAIMGKQ